MPRAGLSGGLYALAAFLLWGLSPIYFKALGRVPALEVVAHRVLWSVLLLALLVLARRRAGAIRAALAEPRTRLLMAASTALMSANWLVFIWAIGAGRVLEVSLGYYVNPLVNVLLGVAVLRERLSPWQGLAVALAAAGVANLALQVEGLPWVSLTLAGTFGLYGLIRKTVRLGALEGLSVETAAMLPFALGIVVFLGLAGGGSFGTVDRATDILLLAAGAVTAVPLLAFTAAARRLDYTTVGFFQYIAPSGHFLLAVFAYGEAFTRAHLVSFALIWAGLAVFSAHGLRAARGRAAAKVMGS